MDNLVARLREQKINTSATKRNYGVIDSDGEHIEIALRISPHYYNTIAEIEEAAKAIEKLTK
jgi:selenocysteine lyase/cysteine desulfurase